MRRGSTARLTLLWGGFLVAHLISAWVGWVYPSQPMGDVVLVYQPWAVEALRGEAIVGVTETWVYPQLALVPMLVTQVLSLPVVPLLGVSGAYLIVWAVVVTALDALAFSVLLGRRPSRPRVRAAWFWTAALLLLGPIALYRIDAITVPIAVVGGLWLVGRPALAAALLTIGAWIKIWPGALLLAAAIAVKARIRILLVAASVSGAVIVVLLLLGADQEVFGFLTEQAGRGLQIEAVAATPFLWLAVAGSARIEYSHEILTFQITAPGVDAVSSALTPVMLLLVAALAVTGVLLVRRGASFAQVFPPLALSLVVALIVSNKVGSPQFQTWLIAPVVIWLVFDGVRARVPAVLVLTLCALTCLVYPLSYDALLRAEMLPVLVLTLRNGLLVVLLIVTVRTLVRVTVRPSNHRE